MSAEIDKMIVFNSNLNNVGKVAAIVEDVVERFQIDSEQFGNILISLTEAVTNAIVHGNQSDESKKVKIQIEKGLKDIVFKVTDEGDGFDYSVLPDPTAPENILKVGGRGVFTMKQLCDLVIFSNNGSTVEMKFRV